jgi:membrane-bound metal-dependent hydrolase YbcI (DUF457 family)
MPLPLGHAAIGWAALETIRKPDSKQSRLSLFIFVVVLANLPDLDILAGLLSDGNGYAFHRGPTHSVLFALLAGYLASRAHRVWRRIPALNSAVCALLIFSHVAADMLVTPSPVSLFWPLEIHFSAGHNGWDGVIRMALFQSVQDVVIAAAMMVYLFGLRVYRKELWLYAWLFPFLKKVAR